MGVCTNKIVRESNIKRLHTLQVLDLLISQLDFESLNVIMQMLHLSSSNNWKNVGCLAQDIRQCNGSQTLDSVLSSDLLQCLRHFDIILF